MSYTVVEEGNPSYAALQFYDINGVGYIPISVAYRIWDDTNKQQLLDWTDAGTPAQAMEITIAGTYNMLTNPSSLTEWRTIIVKTTAPGGAVRYDSGYYTVVAVPDET